MVMKLFEHFLRDPQVYRRCEEFWAERISRIIDSLGQSGTWHSWIPRHYANGKPMDLDGNPISDGRSNVLDRAYRIIQQAPLGDGVEFAAWINSDEGVPSALPRHELVINLSLSEETVQLTERILRVWMAQETTPQDMNAFIASNVPDSSKIGGP